MLKKTLIIVVAVVVVVAAVSITVTAGNLFPKGGDNASSVDSYVTPKENAAKSGEAMRTYETGMEPFIIEGGKLIYTKNLDASVDAYLASGDYKTREYVERKLLADWLFNREAEANGITVL